MCYRKQQQQQHQQRVPVTRTVPASIQMNGVHCTEPCVHNYMHTDICLCMHHGSKDLFQASCVHNIAMYRQHAYRKPLTCEPQRSAWKLKCMEYSADWPVCVCCCVRMSFHFATQLDIEVSAVINSLQRQRTLKD